MVRTLALELAPIRVNALHPGSSATARSGAASRRPCSRRPRAHAARPAGHDEDVADAAVFLLENRGVNGVNLAVDGGWIMLDPT